MLCSECGIVTESMACEYDMAVQPKDTRICKNPDCRNYDRKLMIIEVSKDKDKDKDDEDIEDLYNKDLTDEDLKNMCNKVFSDEEIKTILDKVFEDKEEEEEEDIGDLHIWLDRKPIGTHISEFIEMEVEKRRRPKMH